MTSYVTSKQASELGIKDMPTNYRLQINKTLGNEVWSNDYYLVEETIEDAQDVANELITFEKQIHSDQVQFDYIRISTSLIGDRYFRHIAVNQVGLRNVGSYLPLFNVFRLDMPTANSDPCRKYYRGPVSEDDQVSGVLSGALLTAFATHVNNYLVTPGVLSHIWTPAGNPVVSASFNPRVQMRQLQRHKKKKVV